jgi:hypothetical protein
MNKSWKLISSLSISLLTVSLLAAGCEKPLDRTAQPPAVSNYPSREPISTSGNEIDPSSSIRGGGITPVSTPYATSDHEAQVSANRASTVDPNAPIPDRPPAKSTPKPKVDPSDAYNQAKPTLMGLKLGTDKDSVLGRFSKAKDQFVMDEDTDPVTVYDYTDFSIGFNKQNKLEFVNVHTADIDPGLRGLRLGEKSGDAIAALGKPNSNTSYVLAYKAQGTILKLDIDPTNDTIQSIKLFADN